MSRQPEVLQITAAIGALCIGVLVYVLDRQVEYIYFLPGWLSLESQIGGFFGSIGNYLPTFIHVYALILLTAAVAVPSITKLIPVCLAWFTLDSLFEVAQLNPIAQWIGNHTPIWFSGIPFLDNTADYFLMGTFDVFDLLSIATGALVAYLTIVFSTRRA
ncbi:MAG: hypothetical protein KAU29_12435 [Gammaproteobacteria bacterium]|nr:hypothetical protein [Gammaproteobacteria bacterium]